MPGFSREELLSHARAKRPEFEAVLKKIVEIPSVSVEPDRKGEVHRAAEYAVSLLQSFGAKATLYETKGHPIVYGRFDRGPDYPTVTVYNHLDVQPAEGPDWKTQPFAFIREGDVYLGRGTTDDKGPAMTALFGARYAFEQKIPLNIHFLWELEEEIGSPSFETAIRANAKEFATDSVVVSDTVWVSRARPACPAGLRGLQGFRFELQTGETDQHSGTAGGAARNPVTELCQLIAECVDGKTGRVKIPGFYKDVVPPTKKELEDLKKCGFTVKDFKKDHLFRSLRVDDALEVMKRIWMMPTFEVHGIAGGYQGPGVKTIIPPKATAIVSCRLVPEDERGEGRQARQGVREGQESRREGLGRARAAALRGQDHGTVRRRDPRSDEVRVRQGARVRARGRIDRSRAVDGEGPQVRRSSSSGSRFPSTATTLPTRTSTGRRPRAASRRSPTTSGDSPKCRGGARPRPPHNRAATRAAPMTGGPE